MSVEDDVGNRQGTNYVKSHTLLRNLDYKQKVGVGHQATNNVHGSHLKLCISACEELTL